MRIVLVGRPADRDRVRGDLLRSGIEIVEETTAAPAPSSLLEKRIDAVVSASAPRADFGFDLDEVPQEELTGREREVLALVAEGLSNKTIAATLGISDQTVKFHVAAIIAKLGAANRTDAVRRAMRRGLVAI